MNQETTPQGEDHNSREAQQIEVHCGLGRKYSPTLVILSKSLKSSEMIDEQFRKNSSYQSSHTTEIIIVKRSN